MGRVVYIDGLYGARCIYRRPTWGALCVETAYMGRVVYIDGLYGARCIYRQAYMGRVVCIDRRVWGALYM
jgi:hypothetical protein